MAADAFDVIVVGKGLMGSAAARYLVQAGARVALIGPDEPAGVAGHAGVFASHYDQGRITRRLSSDPVWAELARRAIAAYPAIGAAAGVDFHVPCGGLYVAPNGSNDDYLPRVTTVADQQQIAYDSLSTAEAAAQFPYLSLPVGAGILWEGPPAGYINPRDLVRAQVAAARQQGCTVTAAIAGAIEQDDAGMAVRTRNGKIYRAGKVLLANGAYANSPGLLPRPLALRVKTEFVVLAELPEAAAAQLAGMPTVIDNTAHDQLEYLYLLPPIAYPDGRIYIKLGANTAADRILPDEAAMHAWMASGNSDAMLAPLRRALQSLAPNLPAASWHTRRCLVTYTSHGYPMIDAVIPDRLFVCTGGNGHAAKSSDAIGQLAARLVANGRWADEALRGELFTAVYRQFL